MNEILGTPGEHLLLNPEDARVQIEAVVIRASPTFELTDGEGTTLDIAFPPRWMPRHNPKPVELITLPASTGMPLLCQVR